MTEWGDDLIIYFYLIKKLILSLYTGWGCSYIYTWYCIVLYCIVLYLCVCVCVIISNPRLVIRLIPPDNPIDHSHSSQCSTTGVTKASIFSILLWNDIYKRSLVANLKK